MNVRYRVDLTQDERGELEALLSGGKQAARKLKRAQILLAADAGISDEEIAVTVGVGGSTVYRTKRRFAGGNLERALSEDPRPGAERKLTGNEEALLVATVCSNPPAGRARWTLDLLADEMVQLTAHDSLSRETVRRRLADNDLKPWRRKMWCIPQVDADYVARMEDVLDLYAEEPDPQRAVVCFDESPIQLIGEVRQPIPAAPGQVERYDCEYRRNGTANLFVFLDANRPWRKVKVTERYAVSQLKRKQIEEPFGWGKTIGGLARPMLRGIGKLGFKFTLTMASYNLIRLPRSQSRPTAYFLPRTKPQVLSGSSRRAVTAIHGLIALSRSGTP